MELAPTKCRSPLILSVTLPPGVSPGDTIHVQAPSGALNAIQVPPGMGPGSSFTVEFMEDAKPPTKEEEPEIAYGTSDPYIAEPYTAVEPYQPPSYNTSSETVPLRQDDGFASGFGRR